LGARARVGGFATAVQEDSSTAELEGIEDDLFRFARIVDSTPALRAALVDRDLDVSARQALVTQLLEGKVGAGSLALVRYAISGGRARDIVGTLNWLVEQTAKARGWRIARVRSAAPIEDAQQTTLSESLATLAGAPVELQVVIDERLLSGAVIQIGDLQVDASARGRIDALREHLMPGGWEDSGFHAAASRSRGTTTQTEGAG
jgi:F-type H+-transporting ATPase subunit delta